MGADNVVLLFILVWTFTAVCQAYDDDFSVICENVTGTVRNEVTLTCSVSHLCTESMCPYCCIKVYRFQYPEKYDSTICKQEFPQGSCDQRNRFTCSFTPTTVMTEQFRFFVQTQCGRIKTEFTVNITEPITPETDPEDPGKRETPSRRGADTGSRTGGDSDKYFAEGSRSNGTVFGSIAGCFIIIIIIMTIIYKKKPNYIKPCGFQRRMFLCLRHNEDNSNCPENVI